MDPKAYLEKLWEQMQQQYRNYNASTQSSIGGALRQAQSGASAIGQNNPFNNPYLQALTHGNLTSQGIAPNAPQSPMYGNDLTGVFKGLMDRIAEYSASGMHAAGRTIGDVVSGLQTGYNPLTGRTVHGTPQPMDEIAWQGPKQAKR